jgi:hypothetical protein
MLLGMATGSSGTLPSYVEAIDLPSSTVLWKVQVAPNSSANTIIGQLPVATDSQGLARVVFPGGKSGTFFVGAPAP